MGGRGGGGDGGWRMGDGGWANFVVLFANGEPRYTCRVGYIGGRRDCADIEFGQRGSVSVFKERLVWKEGVIDGLSVVMLCYAML